MVATVATMFTSGSAFATGGIATGGKLVSFVATKLSFNRSLISNAIPELTQ